MAIRSIAFAAGVAAVAAAGGFAVLGQRTSASPAPPTQAWPPQRQELLVALPGQQLKMRTVVLKPEGPGPFPLVVINHGSTENSEERAQLPLPEYPVLSRWFLDRGYVVALPLRPGHGATGGPYLEDQGHCTDPDYLKSGLATAASIQAAIDDLMTQTYVAKTGVVVVGQSAGGWGALALASRNPGMVRAIINMAGGRGGHANGQPNNTCGADRLMETAEAFGESARIPSLWLYAENDSYFAPMLSSTMYKLYAANRSDSEYHMLPPFGGEGHLIADDPEALALWSPIVASFLAKHP